MREGGLTAPNLFLAMATLGRNTVITADLCLHDFLDPWPELPDRIAVIAVCGETIMGMAGCEEDAPLWRQIGCDVLPEYRSKGIGSYLITLLKNKIIEMGDIPFCAAAANIRSQNAALESHSSR